MQAIILVGSISHTYYDNLHLLGTFDLSKLVHGSIVGPFLHAFLSPTLLALHHHHCVPFNLVLCMC